MSTSLNRLRVLTPILTVLLVFPAAINTKKDKDHNEAFMPGLPIKPGLRKESDTSCCSFPTTASLTIWRLRWKAGR